MQCRGRLLLNDESGRGDEMRWEPNGFIDSSIERVELIILNISQTFTATPVRPRVIHVSRTCHPRTHHLTVRMTDRSTTLDRLMTYLILSVCIFTGYWELGRSPSWPLHNLFVYIYLLRRTCGVMLQGATPACPCCILNSNQDTAVIRAALRLISCVSFNETVATSQM